MDIGSSTSVELLARRIISPQDSGTHRSHPRYLLAIASAVGYVVGTFARHTPIAVQYLRPALVSREKWQVASTLSCILLTADILGTSEKTVNVYRARVIQRMQVHSVAQLVRLAETVRLTRAQDLSLLDQSPISSTSLPE
jgi:DNA-binding NarL/FixJ family response regulator